MANRNNHGQADGVNVETVGAGKEAQSIIHVGPIALTQFTGRGDEEPRIRDLDLAGWLEFSDPRQIRKLIKSHAVRGNINPLRNVHDVARFTDAGEARGTVRCTEFWLDEQDALFVATQSGTAKSVLVTKQMIRVFMLARRGLLPQQRDESGLANAIIRLTEVVAQSQSGLVLLNAKVDAVTSRMDRNDSHGLMGRAKARELLDEIQQIADIEFSRTRERGTWNARRKTVEGMVRTHAGIAQGVRMEDAELSKESAAWTKAKQLRGEAETRFKQACADASKARVADNDSRQQPLFRKN